MHQPFRRYARAAFAAVASIALASCSDGPSEPDDQLTVQLAAQMGPPAAATLPGDTTQLIQCELVLKATATGQDRLSAQWGTGVFRFYIGPPSGAPADSVIVSSDDIQASWGAPSIVSGSTQEAHWILTAAIPFSISASLQYTVTGTTTVKKALSQAATCGPTVPAGAAAPTITNLRVTPAGGEVEPGSNVAVTYDFSAPAGLWESEVMLTGGVTGSQRTREHFETSGTRTATIKIPPGADVGQPVTLSVRLTDSQQRMTVLPAPGSFTVVDRTPPELLRVVTHTTFTLKPNEIGGQFAPGDTIVPMVIATDNNGVKWIGWGIDGPNPVRDSVDASLPLRIVVRPEWVGATGMRFWAVDRTGNRTPEMVSVPDSFRVFPLRARTVRQAPALQGDTRESALDARTGTLYIANESRKQIDVLSLATLTYGTPIPLPGYPGSLDLTAGGDSLVVSLTQDRALAVVALSSRTVATVPVTVAGMADVTAPMSVRVVAGGRVLAVGARADGAGLLLDVTPATGEARVLHTENSAAFATLTRTADRTQLFFVANCRRRYDLAADRAGACELAEGSGRLEVDASGTVFARGMWAYRAGWFTPTLFPIDLAPTSTTAPGPDGTIYLSTVRGLLRARVDGTVLDRSPLPQVYGQFLFADGGNTLVAVSSLSDTGIRVYTVDLR